MKYDHGVTENICSWVKMDGKLDGFYITATISGSDLEIDTTGTSERSKQSRCWWDCMIEVLPLLYLCQGQEVGHRSSFYFFWSCCWYVRIKPPWVAAFHCIYLLPSWELPLLEMETALFICTTKPLFAAVRLRKNGSKSLSELIVQCGLPDLSFNNHNILACRVIHIS